MLKRLESSGRRVLASFIRRGFRAEAVRDRIPDGSALRSILIMRWDAIGDMMVCLPYFRKVREAFPDARVGIVVSKRNMPLLRYERGFRTILHDSSPGVYLASLRKAREFRPDAVVDTRMHYDSTTSFIYGALSGARWMLSARNSRNGLPFNVRVPMPDFRMHNADMTRLLLEGLGRPIDDLELDRQVRLSSEELEFAADFWRRVGLGLRGRCVGINMSARDPRHRWPENSVEELGVRLLELGKRPVLFSIPSGRDPAVAIASRHPGVIVAPECPTILHAAALVRDLAMFVTPDTGLVHVSSSYEIPTVGLYVPNEEHLPLWFPWRVESEILMDPESVHGITVGSVLGAVVRLSRRTGALEQE
ncbi:MAG: glycosyltransferase family 9 protein [Candidatus Fermentibacteraceae bacterium]|nr:glycosyltransferase family 9 protein [Candidatus Fermentibacteraceae bacterium]MBN2608289.1 glycosyltransferase family 9 protein [Candidatus Fermentibacteraceae bacterium]